MRLPGQAWEYVRTCLECGYAWRVPRSAARRRIRPIFMFSVAPRGQTVDRAELRREVGAISAEGRVAETFRHCPKCGAEHFTQSPLRGTLP
jgi:DNA-directed RNA polymerase subunit M/transcription elongation factor TFIIS